MDIIVCMKQVLDPEAPTSSFRVDSATKRVIPPRGTPPVLNPFDENALEAALKLKDKNGGIISVISLGVSLAIPVLRKSLAAGADRLIILQDDSFEDLDSYATAFILAAAIRKTGNFDLILCGRQAADTNNGVVGPVLAEIMGLPLVNEARKIEYMEGKLLVEQILQDGYQIVEVAQKPAVVTVSSEAGILRSASLAAIQAARKREVLTWTAHDLNIETANSKKLGLLDLFIPPHRDAACEFIQGNTPEEAGATLAIKMKDAHLL